MIWFIRTSGAPSPSMASCISPSPMAPLLKFLVLFVSGVAILSVRFGAV